MHSDQAEADAAREPIAERPGPTPIVILSAEDRNHLFSVYAVERQDDQNATVVAFAIIASSLTYIIAGTVFLAEHCDDAGCGSLPVWIQLVAPAVPAAFAGMLVIGIASARMRSVYLQRLEAALRIMLPDGAGAPQFNTDVGIVRRPDKLTSKPRIRLVFATMMIFSNCVVFTILIGFTFVTLNFGPWTAAKVSMGVLYGAIEAIEILGLLVTLWDARFTYNEAQPLAVTTPRQLRETS